MREMVGPEMGMNLANLAVVPIYIELVLWHSRSDDVTVLNKSETVWSIRPHMIGAKEGASFFVESHKPAAIVCGHVAPRGMASGHFHKLTF